MQLEKELGSRGEKFVDAKRYSPNFLINSNSNGSFGIL